MTAPAPAPRRYRRPRLKSTLDLLADGDALYLLRPGRDDVVVRDATPAQLRLLERLRRAAPLETLHAEFAGEDVALDDVVAQLGALGLLEDAADDDALSAEERARYDRQLAYFSEVGAPGTDRAACQRRLAQARVTIIGVGGLGSWVALGLACAGVGALELVDGDTVELSNLNRQVLYGTADVGAPKAAAAAAAIARFNPAVECRAHARRVASQADVADVIRGADVVVGTADSPPHEIGHWINSACFARGIPWIGASQFPPKVRVGPAYLPGATGCLDCQRAVWLREHPLLRAIEAQGALGAQVAASFGPACGLVGSIVATDVVHLLTGVAEPATAGRALIVDVRTLAIETDDVPREPGCATCHGPGPA